MHGLHYVCYNFERILVAILFFIFSMSSTLLGTSAVKVSGRKIYGRAARTVKTPEIPDTEIGITYSKNHWNLDGAAM